MHRYIFSCFSSDASIITLQLYSQLLHLLASDAFEGMAQTLPLKQLILDQCLPMPPEDGNRRIMGIIGTIMTLEKLCLSGTNFSRDSYFYEADQVRPALLAGLLMTSLSHFSRGTACTPKKTALPLLQTPSDNLVARARPQSAEAQLDQFLG